MSLQKYYHITTLSNITIWKVWFLEKYHHPECKMADIFKWIFLNDIIWILIKISLINNVQALVQIIALRQPGAGPLFERGKCI